jgi:hypothetical protein
MAYWIQIGRRLTIPNQTNTMRLKDKAANLYPVCHLFFYFKKNQFKEREAYMKYIELFWNRLYYCIFNCDKKTQTL